MLLKLVRLYIPSLKRNLEYKGHSSWKQKNGFDHVIHIPLVTLYVCTSFLGDRWRLCWWANYYTTSSQCADKLTRCFFLYQSNQECWVLLKGFCIFVWQWRPLQVSAWLSPLSPRRATSARWHVVMWELFWRVLTWPLDASKFPGIKKRGKKESIKENK